MIQLYFETSAGSAHSRAVEIPGAGTYRLTLLRDGDDITVTLESDAEYAIKAAPLRAVLGGESS